MPPTLTSLGMLEEHLILLPQLFAFRIIPYPMVQMHVTTRKHTVRLLPLKLSEMRNRCCTTSDRRLAAVMSGLH